MKKSLLYLLMAVVMLLSVTSCSTSSKVGKSKYANDNREFRGAWVQTVFQDARYAKKSPAECQAYLDNLVKTLYNSGFNAIIFQVRPEGDAFYQSTLEPWSRFLTGRQGIAPSPLWDPMEYMVKLCHSYGMEFHAWINPYRMYSSATLNLSGNHLYRRHPEYFVTYAGRLYLNPGLPESRAWIRDVVKDIVSRYDIDAIHMDDYFYPYPAQGETFNDTRAYQTYAPAFGLNTATYSDIGNFRRRSVDVLIKYIHEDIQAIKPWVRFGVSPFGIYRNKSSWSGGSDTNGLQCYDDLYADVLFWAKSGWIDYIVPQIYWAIGYKVADYQILCDWWSKNTPANCQLYIGQNIDKSLDPSNDLSISSNQFDAKFKQARNLKNVKGHCIWYAYQVEDNNYHVRDYLANEAFAKRVMTPTYSHNGSAPAAISGLDGKLVLNRQRAKGVKLTWKAPSAKTHVRFYNVYRFAQGEKVRVNDLSHLCQQVADTECIDFSLPKSGKYTYVVTAIDYYNQESKPVKAKFNVEL